MQEYEMMTIYDADLGETKAKELSKKVQGFVTELKGRVGKTDFWGKRKFAFEINHKQEGFYEVVELELASSSLQNLKQKLNLTKGLVRYLITAIADKKTAKAEKKE